MLGGQEEGKRNVLIFIKCMLDTKHFLPQELEQRFLTFLPVAYAFPSPRITGEPSHGNQTRGAAAVRGLGWGTRALDPSPFTPFPPPPPIRPFGAITKPGSKAPFHSSVHTS